MVLEAWYCCQAGMVWSWGPGYTRQGGTNMVQTISGCQGRRIAARGVDISTGIVTGITVTGITVTGMMVTGIL